MTGYGILAASEQLRHGGIAVTARHYLENRQPSVLGLGHLLTGERNIIPLMAQDHSANQAESSGREIFGVTKDVPPLFASCRLKPCG